LHSSIDVIIVTSGDESIEPIWVLSIATPKVLTELSTDQTYQGLLKRAA
jgi:hypothetical protein